MSRIQLALRVSDPEGSVSYSTLFGVEPAKHRPGYANFAIAEPPLKLVLLEGKADQPTVYVVKADSDALGTSTPRAPQADTCRGTTGCCTPDEHAVDPIQTPEQAKSAAGCGCTR